MKEMIKRIREEKGGFTLAELLIVVAIILVLVAIAVPVFTSNLDQAKQATESANISNVKSVASIAYVNAEKNTTGKGKDAAAGDWYVDKNKNVVKAGAKPDGAVAGPFKVDVVENGDEVQINVTPPANS